MGLTLHREWVQSVLPKRRANSHKGDFGTLHILAGSVRYRGAAVLCTDAALRTGAGIVRLASIEKVCAAAAAQLPCAILHPLEATARGGIAPGGEIEVLHPRPTSLLAGCGMGNTAETAEVVHRLLQGADCPLVLDADGLNTLAGHLDTGDDAALRNTMRAAMDASHAYLVLTPHVGEMARLCGLTAQEVSGAQEAVAAEFAAQHDCVVVLKSNRTVVAGPSGELFVTAGDGNPALSKGGSGDVLAGIIASLVAQGIGPVQAAAAGVWLHAEAARILAEKTGVASLSPAELPNTLCEVFLSLQR